MECPICFKNVKNVWSHLSFHPIEQVYALPSATKKKFKLRICPNCSKVYKSQHKCRGRTPTPHTPVNHTSPPMESFDFLSDEEDVYENDDIPVPFDVWENSLPNSLPNSCEPNEESDHYSYYFGQQEDKDNDEWRDYLNN